MMARKNGYNYPLVVEKDMIDLAKFKRLARKNGYSFNKAVNVAMAFWLTYNDEEKGRLINKKEDIIYTK